MVAKKKISLLIFKNIRKQKETNLSCAPFRHWKVQRRLTLLIQLKCKTFVIKTVPNSIWRQLVSGCWKASFPPPSKLVKDRTAKSNYYSSAPRSWYTQRGNTLGTFNFVLHNSTFFHSAQPLKQTQAGERWGVGTNTSTLNAHHMMFKKHLVSI